ncbi:uncharacterized protein METZ01_LOCUS307896, partial [marine metagenome]
AMFVELLPRACFRNTVRVIDMNKAFYVCQIKFSGALLCNKLVTILYRQIY